MTIQELLNLRTKLRLLAKLKNKAEKVQREGQQNLKDYGFSEDDVEDIFDMIEQEFPDL